MGFQEGCEALYDSRRIGQTGSVVEDEEIMGKSCKRWKARQACTLESHVVVRLMKSAVRKTEKQYFGSPV